MLATWAAERTTRCPIALGGRDVRSAEPSSKIVVGVDGSPPSIAALRWAARQAAVTGGTVVAWEFPVVGGSFGWVSTAPFDDTDCSELVGKTLSAAVAEVGLPGSDVSS